MRELIDRTFKPGTSLAETLKHLSERIAAQDPWDEPTYLCRKCNDTGYLVRAVRSRLGCDTTEAAPCRCDRGQTIRAGQWHKAIYPMLANGRRGLNKQELEAFKAACLRDREHGRELQERVEALRQGDKPDRKAEVRL